MRTPILLIAINVLTFVIMLCVGSIVVYEQYKDVNIKLCIEERK